MLLQVGKVKVSNPDYLLLIISAIRQYTVDFLDYSTCLAIGFQFIELTRYIVPELGSSSLQLPSGYLMLQRRTIRHICSNIKENRLL